MKLPQSLLLLLAVALFACQSSEPQVSIATPQTCEQINSSRLSDQVGFHAIFPGKTSSTDIEHLLGAPEEISPYNTTEEWIYQGFQLTIETKIVTSLTVNHMSGEMLKLGELIEMYGCPESIYAFAPYEDLPPENDSYSTADLMYPSIGLEIYTSFPTSLNDLPTAIVYIPPASLESLIDNIRFPKTEVAWDELIQPVNESK